MDWNKLGAPAEVRDVLAHCPKLTIAGTPEELIALAAGDDGANCCFDVAYEIPGQGRHVEATVARVRNGVVVNYGEPYMRRRDPDCMVIGDDGPTDKDRKSVV